MTPPTCRSVMVAVNCCCSSRNRPASRPVSRLHHATNNKHSSQLGKPCCHVPTESSMPRKDCKGHTLKAATSSEASSSNTLDHAHCRRWPSQCHADTLGMDTTAGMLPFPMQDKMHPKLQSPRSVLLANLPECHSQYALSLGLTQPKA